MGPGADQAWETEAEAVKSGPLYKPAAQNLARYPRANVRGGVIS